MKARIYLQLFLFSVFTGATFHVAQYAVHSFSALSAAAWRFGLAGAAMALLLTVREGWKASNWRANGRIYLLMGAVGVFGFNALFFLGMKHTSALNGALIMGTNPLAASLLARLILKDRISARQGAGIALSLVGVVLVLTRGSFDVIATLSFASGDVLILLGNICWALYSVLGRRYLKNVSSLAATTNTMIIGALFLLAVACFDTSPLPLADVSVGAWSAIAFMAFFTSVLGYLFWNRGMAEVGVSRTSIFFNLVPVVTMAISLFLGTPVTGVQVAGAAFVLSGVLLAVKF